MSKVEAERVARRLWERIGFLALSQPVVYEREIDLMKTANRAQGRDTDFLDAKRKTLAQIAESEARDALAMLEQALLDQRQAGYEECRVKHGILSAEEGVRLLALIENPPAPTPAMIDALNDYLEEDDT